MSCAKGKSGSTSRRYRASSPYDDATLAQKREYWRTKKREQRARLSEGRGTLKQGEGGEKLLHLNGSAVVNSSSYSSLVASSSPLQENNKSCRMLAVTPVQQSRLTPRNQSSETAQSQNGKQLRTRNLSKVPPQLCSISTTAAGSKYEMTRGAASQTVTSLRPSGIQLSATSSVPVVRLTTLTITNGSSAKAAPQPRVSMQHPLVPQSPHKEQGAVRIQPEPLITNITDKGIQATSTRSSVKIEGKAAKAAPQSRAKSAWVTAKRTKEDDNTQPCLESEEERAAKRREQWRLKKREQRAKLAAQLAKAREKTQNGEAALASARVVVQKLHSHSAMRGPGLKQSLARVCKVSYTPLKREAGKFPTEPSNVTPASLSENRQMPQIRVRAPLDHSMLGGVSEKNLAELSGNLPGYMRFSNAPRGIVRCKTPRQRFIEAQKIFMSQRNLRGKAYALISNSRNCPRIDPNDTPEQILAKRREYWRIKKREQRAKLSPQVKARLKEKDSLMRRVKRYQKILEEMRRARTMAGRSLAQSPSCAYTHDSETIGGFIKEDGTVTVNIPQVPLDYGTTSHKREEAPNVFSSANFMAQHNKKSRGIAPIQVNPPCRSLRPAHVKVQSTLGSQSPSKSPHLLSVRLRPRQEGATTVLNNSAALAGQLKLAHPETLQNALSTTGSSLGTCVMKMALSNNVASLSGPSVEVELTEEERMAKKREYWRVKKREQRAAHAAQLKQAALQRRKTQRPTLLQKVNDPVPPSRTLAECTQDAQRLSHSGAPVTLCANDIKQESESVPAVDLNSEPEHAICADIKPPASPPQTPPIPSPQPEPDLALSTDSQATTLRAVASMKKLLEESLSSVMECKSQQTNVKLEQLSGQPESESGKTQGLSEQEMKSNLLQLFFGVDEEVHSAADVSVPACSPHSHSKDPPQMTESLPPLPSTNEVALLSISEPSSHASPYMLSCDGPHQPSTYKTHILRPRKVEPQQYCSPEPPKLHHPPVDRAYSRPQQAHGLGSPSVQQHRRTGSEICSMSSLQKKREYWKLMKRQQRAKLKARQKERQGRYGGRPAQRSNQAPGLAGNPPAKPAFPPKSSVSSQNTLHSIPNILVISPTSDNSGQPPDTIQVKRPVSSISSSPSTEPFIHVEPSQFVPDLTGADEDASALGNCREITTGLPKWMFQDADLNPLPPTLKPPDNPLSSINFRNIQPLGQTFSPIKTPQSSNDPKCTVTLPSKLAPVSTMVPPKPIPGEPEEDFLKRKREYWRIKKKEQRARKAILNRDGSQRRASNNWQPTVQTQTQDTRDSDRWVSSSDGSERLSSSDADSFPSLSFSAPLEDSSEFLFANCGNSNSSEENSVYDIAWRSRYLMDYDPLNQLLVCIVCGELQYSHTVEGARAHIEESHPDSLRLEPHERLRILEAWDEQVSQRERFFSSQLQQHDAALTEANRT
ncbi:uncharacterized protein si:dkey-28a3.2 [Thalassophryne amazonica]|uniref:uncharacterized protein si:dkey-28a3.2 n=1 Tax=Thalassophryne amazonica TaxID=390379 RepID=UPI0014711B39|nr:uncharacterized protein si:dkey-28a3.2 [Thalassophryne amazonica]XP_034020237.1 uncharacterized protein si:dkey-28a3.2 [Thalassophryne amazonica]